MPPGLIAEGVTSILLTVLGLAIPMVAIVMFFRLMMEMVRAKHREKIAMIEHGLTEPPPAKKGNGLLVSGLFFAGIGVALVIGIPIAGEATGIVGGLVPLFMGLALILGHLLTRKGK